MLEALEETTLAHRHAARRARPPRARLSRVGRAPGVRLVSRRVLDEGAAATVDAVEGDPTAGSPAANDPQGARQRFVLEDTGFDEVPKKYRQLLPQVERRRRQAGAERGDLPGLQGRDPLEPRAPPRRSRLLHAVHVAPRGHAERGERRAGSAGRVLSAARTIPHSTTSTATPSSPRTRSHRRSWRAATDGRCAIESSVARGNRRRSVA